MSINKYTSKLIGFLFLFMIIFSQFILILPLLNSNGTSVIREDDFLQNQEASDYYISSNWLTQPVIIDGNITTPLEWADATKLNLWAPKYSINATLYFKNNATHLAILCDAYGDETKNTTGLVLNLLDHWDIGFDTGNDDVRTDGREDSFTLSANGSVLQWTYSSGLGDYNIVSLENVKAAANFTKSSQNTKPHQIYEIMIALNVIYASSGGKIGITSTFTNLFSQGWPYDSNASQYNNYPLTVSPSILASWGTLKFAAQPPLPFIKGIGNNLVALFHCEKNGTLAARTELTDFNITIPTGNWNQTWAAITLRTIYAPNDTDIIEDASASTVFSTLAPGFAQSFRVNTSCYLINTTVQLWPETDGDGATGDIIVRVYTAVNSSGKAKPSGAPGSGYLTTQDVELTETAGYVYVTFNFTNLYLNTTNTYDNTFFLFLYRAPFSFQSPVIYWKRWNDPIVGSFNDSRDEAFVWATAGANWAASTSTVDFDMKIALAPPSNSPLPSQVGIRINGTSVYNSGANQGKWNTSKVISGNNVLFNVQSDWTISFNVNWKCFYEKTGVESVEYIATPTPYVNWNATTNIEFPNTCGEFVINISIPADWDATPPKVLNGSSLTALGAYNPANYIWYSAKGIVQIKNMTNTLNYWRVNCTGYNYLVQLTLQKKVGENYLDLLLSGPVNITDILQINGSVYDSIGNPISTLASGNLTIYTLQRTVHIEQNVDVTNGVLTFTDWVIADDTDEFGRYKIRLDWFNGFEIGFNETDINVIIPTSAKKITPLQSSFLNGASNNLINVTVFYNCTYWARIGGISDINATFRIYNYSTLWKDWSKLNQENLGFGYYNYTLDYSAWTNGTYTVQINLNKTGYQTQNFNFTVIMDYNTNLILVTPSSTSQTNYYPENLTIEVNYTKFSGEELTSANVGCKVNGGPSLPLVVKNNLFIIRLNSTVYGVGNYNVTIIASQMGYYPGQLYINWTIQTCPTGSTLLVNGSYSQFEFYIGEQMLITSYFNDTTHNQPILSALATLTWLDEDPQSPSSEGLGYYNWILDSSLQPAGLWNFTLELKKPNYQNQTLQFDIYVRYNTILEWFTPPPLTIQPFTTLTMAVNLSHFTLTPTQEPVAGQNIIYSITTNLGTSNYSKITSTTGIASFSDYMIPVGVTSLSIQVIYAGNLTEFPTNLPGSVIILYPTRVDVFVDKVNITGGSLVVYKFIGLQSRGNFTVFYYNSTTQTKFGIPAATAQYQIINKTGGLWATWTNLNHLGGGYYNITLDVSSWQNDTYYIGIRLNKTGFQMQQFNITMNLVFSTNIVLLQPISTIIGKLYPENLTIQVNYTKATGDEILTAYVRVIINGTTTLPLSIVGGLYQTQLNSTAYGVGTYNLSIMASLLGYYPQAINVIWIVQVCPTNYQVYVNWSHSPNQFYYGQQMHITIRYYDTNHSVGLQYALVNITLPSGLKQTLGYISSGNYSIVLNSSSWEAGLWNLAFIIRKPNYQNHTFNLQLYARYDTLLQWLTDFPTEAAPGQTLSLMVRMTHTNGMPVVGQNITFVITTNLGIEIKSAIFTNGSGISSDDYVILSGVSTIHIVAIFGGNLTEFSSSITIDTDITVFSGGFWEKYWWTILIGVILAVVVGATVRSRRKAKVVKETKKKEIMSSFQDVTKILHLVVIHKGSGSDIFDYKVQERMDPTLLAGFIQAVKEFGRELDKGEK